MKQGLCEIVFVLDMTGSMDPLKNDAVGGFNSFVDDQKKVPGEAKLTLVLFNSEETRKLFDGLDLQTVRHITDADYRPNGMTPLLDAIGFAIDEVGKRLEGMPDAERPEKVIFAIMTDGEENFSKRYKRTEICDKIKHQRDVYKWEFLFLGANIDSFAEAGKLGIDLSNAIQYDATSKGTRDAYAKASVCTIQYRTK